MYTWASETLAARGYHQYEISNWAKTKADGQGMNDGDKPPLQAQGTRTNDGAMAMAPSILPPSAFIPAFACRHNLQYWRNQPYLGFGAGAHGCAAGHRYSNVLAPGAYIDRLTAAGGPRDFPFSPALLQSTAQTRQNALDETMMLGLRLIDEGVRATDFQARFGVSLADTYGRILRRLQQLQLITSDDDGVRLTPAGRLLGNRVFREFV